MDSGTPDPGRPETAVPRDLPSDELLPEVYDELRAMARAQVLGRSPTVHATSLVHEAWVRLVERGDPRWKSRAHFVGAACQAMRRIVVEEARKKNQLRRGGAWSRSSLTDDELPGASTDDPGDVLAMDEALGELKSRSPIQAKIVALRFFVGLSMAEVADSLGLGERRVEREWAFARVWLARRMGPSGPGTPE